MPIVNITGAQATQTIDITVDEVHITGNWSIAAGNTITFNPGAGPMNPIRWDGNFNQSGGGTIILNGTAAQTIRIQPNGAPSTWSSTTVQMLIQHQTTAVFTWSYTDFFSYLILTSAGNNAASAMTLDNIRAYGVGQTGANPTFSISPSNGTYSLTNIGVWAGNDGGGAFTVSPTGGDFTIDKVRVDGSSTGITLNAGAGVGTWAISNVKAVRCATAYTLTSTKAHNITNMAALQISGSVLSGNVTNSSTYTRFVCTKLASTGITYSTTVAGGVTHTFDEAYMGGEGVVFVQNAGAGTLALANSVLARAAGGAINTAGNDALFTIVSSGNDLCYQKVNGAATVLNGGTSDNDFIHGSNGGWAGIAKDGTGDQIVANTGYYQDFADADFTSNVDTDSGNATSTHVPTGYRNLAANRTNARATANKPLTVSGIATSGLQSYTVQIDFNTGIRAQSRILLSTSSGFDTQAPEIATPWKYDGFISPDKIGDWTLPATAHTHNPILRPNTTYFWRAECIDPCGRRFLSTEQTVTTTQAVPPEAANTGRRRPFCKPFTSGD